MADIEKKSFTPSPKGLGAGVWSLAALSVAAFLCSVLTAKLLASIVERGEGAAIAFNHNERSMRDLANGAPTPHLPQTVTVVRSVAIDGTATATIPSRPKAPLRPCGDSK